MHKISFAGSKGLFINYIFKVMLLSTISVIGLSALFSAIALKIDLDEKYFEYISVVITTISSALVSYISVKSFKNNGFIIGALSVMPIIIYSFINFLICKNSLVIFLIKLLISVILGGISGYFSIKKGKKIRVK